MRATTDLLLAALGDEDRFKLVAGLLTDGPKTQTALARDTGANEKRAGEHLRLLRALGIVEREPSARGKWSVSDPSALATLFATAAGLAAKLDSARAAANRAERATWLGFVADDAEPEAEPPAREGA